MDGDTALLEASDGGQVSNEFGAMVWKPFGKAEGGGGAGMENMRRE